MAGVAAFTAIPRPKRVSGLSATPIDATEVVLAWDTDPRATSYEVYRSDAGADSYVLLGATSEPEFSDTTVVFNTSYDYRVRGENSRGFGNYSFPVRVNVQNVPPPTAPSDLVATAADSETIDLTWTDNSDNETGFEVYRRLTSVGGDFTLITTVGVGVTTYQDTPLAAGTSYDYQIRAIGEGGRSDPSNTDTEATDDPLTVPAAPSGLAGSPFSSTRINLTWTDNADNEDSFVIERAPDSGGAPGTYAEIDVIVADSTGYQDIGLTAETPYWYRVKARNTVGDSTASNAVQVTTLPAPADDVSILPDGVAFAVAEADADSAEWQAYEAVLDAELNTTSDGEYIGSQSWKGAMFALGYQCLKDTNPTKANNYAARAWGIAKCGLRENESGVGLHVNFYQFIARGDGLTTTFDLPGTRVGSSAVAVKLATVSHVSVLRESSFDYDYLTGVNDHHILKVSNTSDGSADYAPGTDWTHRAHGPPHLIDWRDAGAKPANSATYYATIANPYGATVTTAFTITGAQITFTSPPTANQAIFVKMLYDETGGGLPYQMTCNGYGDVMPGSGFGGVFEASAYAARNKKHHVMTMDWIAGWVDLPAGAMDEGIGVFEKIVTSVQAGGVPSLSGPGSSSTTAYRHPTTPSTNYGSGVNAYYVLCCVFLENRVANGATYRANAISRRTTNLLPALAAPAEIYVTLKGGHYGEGWTYGTGATRRVALQGQLMKEAGWLTPTEEQNYANSVLKFWTLSASTPDYVYAMGDNTQNPQEAVGKEYWAFLSGVATDATAAAWARHHVQDTAHGGTLDPKHYDLMFYDGSGTATNPATSGAPTGYFAEGTGVVTFRDTWGDDKVWLAMDGQGKSGYVGGASQQPGHIQIYRGADVLMPNSHGQAGGPYVDVDKRFAGSVVQIDDARDGDLGERWRHGNNHASFGVRTLSWENGTDYGYAMNDSRAIWRRSGATTATANIVRQDRAFLFIRPNYVVGIDRVITTQSYHPKWWYQYLNTANVLSTAATSQLITGGTFTLTYNGNTSAALAYNASAATVKAALEGLGTGTVSVVLESEMNGTASTPTGQYRVTFSSPAANKFPITGDGSSLTTSTGGAGRVTVRDFTDDGATFDYTLQIIELGATITDATWSVDSGDSRLFTKLLCSETLDCWHERPKAYGGSRWLRRVVARYTSEVAAVNYVFVHQVEPNTTASMDATEHIVGTLFQGARVGNVVALFGKGYTVLGDTGYQQDASEGTSYSFTGTGATVKHFVSDLAPSTVYTLSGDASGTPTTSAAGVLEFSTSGSGAKTVTITG